MRAVMDAYQVPPVLADQRIELRKQRQSILTRNSPPKLRVIVEEIALRRPVGDCGVMEGQLRLLLDVAEQPAISIQVIPTSVGLHPAEGKAYIMLGFLDSSEPKIVYLEHLNESQLLDDPGKTVHYDRAFDRPETMALSPDESASLIRAMLTS